MDYICINPQCEGKGKTVVVTRTITTISNGTLSVSGNECPKCGDKMEDRTTFQGFGTPKKASGDKGKNYYGKGN